MAADHGLPADNVQVDAAPRIYEVAVSNPSRRCRGVARAELDGLAVDASAIPLVDDGRLHQVRVVLGA